MYSRLLIFALVAIQSTIFSPLARAEKDAAHELINSQGCKACHTLGGDGGTIAGSFEAMRGKLTREQVRSKLVSQDQRHGNGKIPDFSHLAEKDIDILVNFIQPDQRTKN
jgi:mono/diheme cytochrome c family protein